MTSTFVEIAHEGKVLRALGTVNTYMRGFYYNFVTKVVCRGGHYQQDSLTKFVFSDGTNISPIRTVVGAATRFQSRPMPLTIKVKMPSLRF